MTGFPLADARSAGTIISMKKITFSLIIIGLSFLFFQSPASAEKKWLPYALELDHGWRPAGSEILNKITGEHFSTKGVFKKPWDFDPGLMSRLFQKIAGKDFENIHDEFQCRYTAFRYALARWVYSTNDPNTERIFREGYVQFQNVCRKLYRKHAFKDLEEQEKAEWVKEPFEVCSEYLRAYLNEDAHQLETRENPTRPFTIAERYLYYPNSGAYNLLKDAYLLVDKYFSKDDATDAFTWERYIYEIKFQSARKTLYVREWDDYLKMYEDYLGLDGTGAGYRTALKEAEKMARFNYRRLKKEFARNSLPYFSDVDALYQSDSLEDYFREREEEKILDRERANSGKKKEIVIFVHGMGEGRGCWDQFPELLDTAGLGDPDLDRYFKVYVWVYQTWEKSAGVETFSAQLEEFIDEIKEKEGVEKVNIICHSFGGTVSVRYLVSTNSRTGLPNASSVERFIGIAPCLHGSFKANLIVDVFKAPPKKFRKKLPLFSSGMPLTGAKGDLQILESEMGSDVNIYSSDKLDELAGKKGSVIDKLKWLTIIGDPFWHNFLDLDVAPWILIPPRIGRCGQDQLIKVYAANLNHIFLTGQKPPFKNIGFDRSNVRYDSKKHFPVIAVRSREDIIYRYVLSFLKDELIPQAHPGKIRPRRFLVVLRVAPADADQATDLPPGVDKDNVFFRKKKQVDPTGKLALPALEVRIDGKFPGRIVNGGYPRWNKRAGTYILEGKLNRRTTSCTLPLRISAEGYRELTIEVPVKDSEVTYLTGLKLDPE